MLLLQYDTFVHYTSKYTKNDDQERKIHSALFFPRQNLW